MILRHDFLNLSKAARPRILQLAREGRLVEECFKEFISMVYTGAPQDQVQELRVVFFAGAAELSAMQMYALDPEQKDVTDEDMELMTHILDEIETHHKRIIELANAQPGMRQ